MKILAKERILQKEFYSPGAFRRSKFQIVLFLVFLQTTQTFGSLNLLNSTVDVSIVNGSEILNTPHRNSSSGIRNMPFIKILQESLPRGIGNICEYDSDCGNYSICLLKFREDDRAIKLCDCDPNEMILKNQTCFVKPGRQCYFPQGNPHGYKFIECLPGSTCLKTVLITKPENGYCLCNLQRKRQMLRGKVNEEFEMAKCSGHSSFSLDFLYFFSVVHLLFDIFVGENGAKMLSY